MFKSITVTARIPHPQNDNLSVEVSATAEVQKDLDSTIDAAIAALDKMAVARFANTPVQKGFLKAKSEHETAQKAQTQSK